MDLITLDKTTFVPLDLCEGYSSLIWTERFFDSGEFILKTPLVGETIQKMPVGSLISLIDATEVMFVETHSIEPDSESGELELTVTGRSFDSFLEHRVVTPTTYGETWEVLRKYTPTQMIAMLIWNALVNTSGEDPMRVWQIGLSQDVMLVVPNVSVSSSNHAYGVEQSWYMEPGTIYEIVKNIQKRYTIGVRSIRPLVNELVGDQPPYNELSFDNTRTVQRGVITATSVKEQNLRVDVYRGTNRTIHQGSVTPVIFQSLAGHLINQKYILSDKLKKDYARIYTSQGVMLASNPIDSTNVGLNRKVMLVDGGSKPDSTSFTTWSNSVVAKALIELSTKKIVNVSEGEMSPNSPYLYGRDYFLGDTVTFSGTYDSDVSMFVSEIVRTNDANGTTLTPGLTAI